MASTSDTLTRGATTVTTAASWEKSITQQNQTGKYHFSTAGKYVDQDIDLKVTAKDGSYSLSTSGTTTVKPEISKKTETTNTNVKSSAATTTKPTSGYYVGVQSAEKTNELTPTVGITAGWIDATDAATTTTKANVGAVASDVTYVPITAATTGTSNEGTQVGSDIKPSADTQYINITEGYTPARKWVISSLASATKSVPEAIPSLGNNTDSAGTGKLVLASGGALKIPAGYIESALYYSLAGLVPDDATITASTQSPYILSGYTAYDKDGALITGGISTWTPSTTYFTSDSTKAANAAAIVDSGKYTGATNYYVKKGSASVDANQTITVSKESGPTRDTTNNKKFNITVSGSKSITGSATAGWVETVSSNTVSASGTIQLDEATFTTNSADVTLDTTDSSSIGGKNIAAVIGTKATAEPTSGYYVAFKGSGSSKVNTAGYVAANTVGSTTTSGVKYFPIAKATFSGNKVATSGYIEKDEVVVSAGAISAADSTAIIINSSAGSVTGSAGSMKFTIPLSASATAYAKVTTNGYVTSALNTSKSLSGSANLNIDLYEGAFTYE